MKWCKIQNIYSAPINGYDFFIGRYPGAHGIIANQFFDQSQGIEKTRGFFDHLDQRSTKHLRWWQPSEKPFEPIWVTAKTQGVKFSAFLWGR